MKGVDISHYQKNLTIREIRNAGYDFAVIKLTEGSWFKDAAAFDFYREALELKFPVGCYCYSHAVTPDEAREEAQFLLQAINRFPMPCGIYLDVEEPKQLELSDRQLRDMAKDWCDVIRSAGYTRGSTVRSIHFGISSSRMNWRRTYSSGLPIMEKNRLLPATCGSRATAGRSGAMTGRWMLTRCAAHDLRHWYSAGIQLRKSRQGPMPPWRCCSC